MDDQTTTFEVRAGEFIARRMNDDLSWGVGDIRPLPEYVAPEAERELIRVVLEHVQPVADDQKTYTSCTDGRIPDGLVSGEPVPVREQLVGADIVTCLFIADMLGTRFYDHPDASVQERVQKVVQFLHENGLNPSSHLGCGAGTNFAVILQQEQQFSQNPQYVGRLRELLPDGAFDDGLYAQIIQNVAAHLHEGAYDGLTLQTFLDAVEQTSGQYAIAKLKDDGRGVHGHVEEAIVRVKVDGYAIDEAGVAAATNGREVFGVNDMRMDKLAALFSRGDKEAYRLALIGAEDFASSGHGTLAHGLPTWVVTRV